MNMVEKELKASKPGTEFTRKVTEQMGSLWGRLSTSLPPELRQLAGISREERTRRYQEIFSKLEASLSEEQKARLEEQGHLKVKELTKEQQEILRQGAHLFWATSILTRPPIIEELDTFNIGFGENPGSGKRGFRFIKHTPDGSEFLYETDLEL